jgi:hypothetical protein
MTPFFNGGGMGGGGMNPLLEMLSQLSFNGSQQYVAPGQQPRVNQAGQPGVRRQSMSQPPGGGMGVRRQTGGPGPAIRPPQPPVPPPAGPGNYALPNGYGNGGGLPVFRPQAGPGVAAGDSMRLFGGAQRGLAAQGPSTPMQASPFNKMPKLGLF